MLRSTVHRRPEQVHHVTSQTILARLSTTYCPFGHPVSSARSGGKTSACSVHACPLPTPRRGVVGKQQSWRHLLSAQGTISRVSRANRARARKRADDAVVKVYRSTQAQTWPFSRPYSSPTCTPHPPRCDSHTHSPTPQCSLLPFRGPPLDGVGASKEVEAT